MNALDSDGDGVFSEFDDAWSSVYVWQDANQNGVSEEGELLSLSDLQFHLIAVEQIGDVIFVDPVYLGEIENTIYLEELNLSYLPQGAL